MERLNEKWRRVMGGLCGLVLVLGVQAGAIALGPEQILNGGMEARNPPSNWTLAGGTFTGSSIAHSGVQSANSDAGGTQWAGFLQNVTLKPGTQYQLDYYFLAPNETQLYVIYADSTGRWGGIDSKAAWTYYEWTHAQVTFTTSASPVSWAYVAFLNGSSTGVHYVDDVSLREVITTELTFTPAEGFFAEAQNVVVTCQTPDAVIRYTTDGSDPSETNGTVIISGNSVLVDHSMTLKARAWVNGTPGTVKSAVYTFTSTSIIINGNMESFGSLPIPEHWGSVSGIVDVSTDTPSGGGHSLSVTNNGSGYMQGAACQLDIPVYGGRNYQLMLSHKGGSPRWEMIYSNGQYIADNLAASDSSWTNYTIPISVPAGVSSAYLVLYAISPGTTVLFDDVYLLPESVGYSRPETIPYGAVAAMDGNLADWADATWIPLDKAYDGGGAADITQAYYAARWGDNGNKVYVAIKVQDTALSFTSDYGAWNGRDAIEVYLHTTGAGPTNFHDTHEDTAQQYAVGIKLGTTDQVWTSLTDTNTMPSGAGFQAAGKVEAGWIYYEMSMTPFEYFGGLTGQPNVISTLHADDVIGLDVCVVGHNGTDYTGMRSENLLTGKSNNWSQFGRHVLAAGVPGIPGDANNDGKVDVSDLGILAANYGTTSGATWPTGDFNNDGKVDVSDLGILAANYGTGTGTALDFAKDADALGLSVEAKEETLTTSNLGCGLPLIAGLFLTGLFGVRWTTKE